MKNIVITGCTSGIGTATAEELLKQGHKVYGLVRNVDKAKEVFAKHENFRAISCVLEDFSSIKAAATELIELTTQIDVLINNAGALFQKRQVAKSGHEKTLMVNYLAPFYLTNLLMPQLLKSKSRVVNLSSGVHPRHKVIWNDLELEKKYSGIVAYANAKLFMIWFTKLLHFKYHKYGMTSYAVHPGLVATNFGDNLGAIGRLVWRMMKFSARSSEKGAETSIYLATENGVESGSGNYFVDCKVVAPDAYALDFEDADKLWDLTVKMCNLEAEVEK